jgi:hypothetical protein
VSVHSIAWLTESLTLGKLPAVGNDHRLSPPIDPKTAYQKSSGKFSADDPHHWIDLVPKCKEHGLQTIVKHVVRRVDII